MLTIPVSDTVQFEAPGTAASPEKHSGLLNKRGPSWQTDLKTGVQ